MDPNEIALWLRRMAIGLTFTLHIQGAAFVIGAVVVGSFMHVSYVVSRRPEFDRLARWMAFSTVVVFSTGSVLAIIVIMLLMMLWPILWINIFHVTFWIFTVEAMTFVITIAALFPWYLGWRRWSAFPAVLVPLGLLAVLALQWQQAMIDMVAGYQLTPVTMTKLLAVMFNPTALPLDLHRFVGDISWAGYAFAGLSAFAYLRAKTEENRRFWDWAANMGFLFGIGLLFLQPAIGLEYVVEIRLHSPAAFNRMMRGELAPAFLLMVTFLSTLFVVSGWYMWRRMRLERAQRTRWLLTLLVLMLVSGLLLMVPRFIGPTMLGRWIWELIPGGAMNPWKYAALASLSSFGMMITATYLMRLRETRVRVLPRPSMQWMLIALAIVASMQMFLMGFIRENGRQPWLIYGEMLRNESQAIPLPPAPTTTPTK